MGGQHQEWGCVGDAISRNTRSIIIRLNTYEDLWLRVSRKSVVAVPMEVAPRARSCRVKGQRNFNRMRQPQNTSLHDFLSILSEAVGEKQINFQYRQCIVLSNYLWCRCSQFSTLQQAKFIHAPYIDELSFFAPIRALSKEAHNLIAKFRIEKDPRRS